MNNTLAYDSTFLFLFLCCAQLGYPRCLVSVSHPIVSNYLHPHGLQPARLLCPWNSPGKNAGVDSHSLLQGIFPTQGSNLGFPHCRQILYCLSYQGEPNPRCLLCFQENEQNLGGGCYKVTCHHVTKAVDTRREIIVLTLVKNLP